MGKNVRKNTGITLVALVVTIIILLILSGISISILSGENGILNIAKKATQEYEINQAKEELQMEIINLRIEEESKGDKFDKEDLPRLNNDKIDVGDVSVFPVEIIYEKFLFNVDEYYNVIYVGESDRTIVTYITDPDIYTNGDIVSILINVKNPKGIKTIEYPDGDILNVGGAKERSIDYTVEANGVYTFKIIDSDNKELKKDIVIYLIDKLSPLDFIPEVTRGENSVIITHDVKDAEADEKSVKSGIEYCEYYLKFDNETEYIKYDTNKIDGILEGKYQLYVIAFDRAGNKKWSKIVDFEITTQFKDVFSSTVNTLATDFYGNLYGWGSCDSNIVGSSSIDITKPRLLKEQAKFVQISIYNGNALAIDENKYLWAWGKNDHGQVGNGTSKIVTTPIQIKEDIKFDKIKNNSSASFAIDVEGNLWTWGYNHRGQLGDGTTDARSIPQKVMEGTKFIEIENSSSYSTFAIDENNNLWAWGYNNNGQLGDGTTTDKLEPVQINKEGIKFVKVISRGGTTYAIDKDGNIWACGLNDKGQLGDGTTINRLELTQITQNIKFTNLLAGAQYSIAIDENKNLWAWGVNDKSQLGDGTTENRNKPIKIIEDIKFDKIVVGSYHNLAIDVEGNLWTWGYNNRGQLGDGTTDARSIPQKIMEGTKFIQIESSTASSFAIDINNNLWSWGSDAYGNLGLGGKANGSKPVQVKIND